MRVGAGRARPHSATSSKSVVEMTRIIYRNFPMRSHECILKRIQFDVHVLYLLHRQINDLHI